MLSVKFHFSATWRVPVRANDEMLCSVFDAFDADGAEPCVRPDDAVPQAILVTWDAWLPFESSADDVHRIARDYARTFVPARMAQAGLPAGELARLDFQMFDDDD